MTNNKDSSKQNNLKWFKKFVDICEKHNLWYSVFYGTLIGAIREKGPIEWDDDFDVIMTPESYEKLKLLYPKNCLDSDTNKKYPLIIPKFTPNIDNFIDNSAWVDIFLLTQSNTQNINKYRSLKSKIWYSVQIFKSPWKPRSFKEKIMKILSIPLWLIMPKFRYKHALNVLQNNAKSTNDVSFVMDSMFSPSSGTIFNSLSFKTIKKEFVDFEVNVPKDYHIILTQRYGDYMTPINDGLHHEDMISVTKK